MNLRQRLRRARNRGAVGVISNGAALGFTAWRADGHYGQPQLWTVGVFAAALLVWLTMYVAALVLLDLEAAA